jgi:hypothetical protein
VRDLAGVGQRSIKPLPRDHFALCRFHKPLARAGQRFSPERHRSAGQKSVGHGGLASPIGEVRPGTGPITIVDAGSPIS